jgi:hypothetical protein
VDDDLAVLGGIVVVEGEFGLEGTSEEDYLWVHKFLEHICDYK